MSRVGDLRRAAAEARDRLKDHEIGEAFSAAFGLPLGSGESPETRAARERLEEAEWRLALEVRRGG